MYLNETIKNDEKNFEKIKHEYYRLRQYSRAAEMRGEIGLMVSCNERTDKNEYTDNILYPASSTGQRAIAKYTTSVQLLLKEKCVSFPIEILRDQLIYLHWILASLTSGISIDQPVFLVQSKLSDFPDYAGVTSTWRSFVHPGRRATVLDGAITTRHSNLLTIKCHKIEHAEIQESHNTTNGKFEQFLQSRHERVRSKQRTINDFSKTGNKKNQLKNTPVLL